MSSDFYEDDEPVEKVKAAFERGVQGKTARPTLRTRLARLLLRWSHRLDPAPYGYARGGWITTGTFCCEHLSTAGPFVGVSCGCCGPLARVPA